MKAGKFGVWDAPMTDELEPIDVPIGRTCDYCREPFDELDNGAILPHGFAVHRECSLRSVFGGIGHHVDHDRYCRSELGTDAGLSRRMSAILVWDWHVNGRTVTEDDLEAARA